MARKVGIVTAAATGGSTVGAALAAIIVWTAGQGGVDMTPIETPLTIILTAGLGVIGGWLVPSNKGDHAA